MGGEVCGGFKGVDGKGVLGVVEVDRGMGGRGGLGAVEVDRGWTVKGS